ncbi:hypothetical protein [Agromyces sp. Soil535]|uniref:hypothetical protein n=1 Tax=Agromyces sp. Soil535 TaxID=1736390 RepID=UPI0012E3782C|nr:hypothetical protein [Agromyces sp. Soil535]
MDHDPLIAALTGRAVTPDRIDGARRHLVMLRSLHDEVRLDSIGLAPPPPGAWQSAAAEGYAELLDDLRMRLAGAMSALADAETALEHRIRRLEHELEAQGDVGQGAR